MATRRKILQKIGENGIFAINEAERQGSFRLLDSEPLNNTPDVVLAEAFDWRISTQGREFWEDVQKSLTKKKGGKNE